MARKYEEDQCQSRREDHHHPQVGGGSSRHKNAHRAHWFIL